MGGARCWSVLTDVPGYTLLAGRRLVLRPAEQHRKERHQSLTELTAEADGKAVFSLTG